MKTKKQKCKEHKLELIGGTNAKVFICLNCEKLFIGQSNISSTNDISYTITDFSNS